MTWGPVRRPPEDAVPREEPPPAAALRSPGCEVPRAGRPAAASASTVAGSRARGAGRALEFATSRHWDTSGTGERYGPGHARWKGAVSGMLGGARARAKRTPGGACHYAGRWVTLTDDIGLLVGDRVSERR